VSWTRPAGLRAQVQKLWDRGDLLASVVSGEPLFPRRLTLKGPTSQEMAERFDEVRAWIANCARCRTAGSRCASSGTACSAPTPCPHEAGSTASTTPWR
jgi:hypothetical protein